MSDGEPCVVLSADAWRAFLAELARAPKVDNRLAEALSKPHAFRLIAEDRIDTTESDKS